MNERQALEAWMLAEIERSRAEHPVDRCDLHRIPTGKCTCGDGPTEGRQ